MLHTALLLLTVLLSSSCSKDSSDCDAFQHWMIVGRAQIENHDAAAAVTAYRRAATLHSESTAALRNLARAQLIAQDPAAAVASLNAAHQLQPESAAISYLTGLAYLHQTDHLAALPHLEHAVRLDPHQAALRFQLSTAYQAEGRLDDSVTQLRETLRLDPLHGTAHYRLASHAARAGDAEIAAVHRAEFARLRRLLDDETRTPEALEQCLYITPELPQPCSTDSSAAKPAALLPVRFIDATNTAFADKHDRSAVAAAILDVDEQGRCTVFVIDTNGQPALLRLDSNGSLQRTAVEGIAGGGTLTAPGLRCLAGNVFDPTGSPLNDILLWSPSGLTLLLRTGPDTFVDHTRAAGLGDATADGAVWVDTEHDGDLDLLLAGDKGLQLWLNGGDGRFTPQDDEELLPAGHGAHDVLAVDLDLDEDIDIVVAGKQAGTRVLQNQRSGSFEPRPDPPGPWPAAQRLLADDIDNDGAADVLLLRSGAVTIVFGRSARRETIPLPQALPQSVALVDFDNDGWLDLCFADSGGGLHLWRNQLNPSNAPGQPFLDVTSDTGLDQLAPFAVRSILEADLDGDGDGDLLLLTAADQLRWLRNDGGHLAGRLSLQLVGTKSNPGGIGTRVDVLAGDFRVTRFVDGLPIEIGLAGHRQLDAVRAVWSNGVVENLIDVTVAGDKLTLIERNVAAGSCPFLYATTSQGSAFVTDLLGNAPWGLSLRRDLLAPADPEEIVALPPLVPLDGAYELQLTEEFREVLYLDQVELLAFDHAPDLELHSTDKIKRPPYAPSEVWALSPVASLRDSRSDDGTDRTAALQSRDGVFAPSGPALPPALRGLTRPLAIELDFGALPTRRPLALVLTGWLQYGDSSVNVAASQNSQLAVIPPRLDAQGADGHWQPVDVEVGMPAGKNKTIVVDLDGKLPSGCVRLRLTTSFEIRWDRIALMERSGGPAHPAGAVPPQTATLSWRGFSELRVRAPGQPETPEYAMLLDAPPWRRATEGWCTPFGDARPLVDRRDGRLAILNAGDALTLRFDARAFAPLAPGAQRSFFLRSVGWAKDADVNTLGGEHVAPLPPAAAMATEPLELSTVEWTRRDNTRWVSAERFSSAR